MGPAEHFFPPQLFSMASSALLFLLLFQEETQAQMPGPLSHKLLGWHSGCPSGSSKGVSYKATGDNYALYLTQKVAGGLMWCGGCPLERAVEDRGHRPFLLGLRRHTLNGYPPLPDRDGLTANPI